MSFDETKSHTRSSSASYAQGMPREFAPSNSAAFAGARSPSKAKNTSHVPCKFYPFGTCQAGAACQFSHDLDPMTQNAPCKYFAKGSCRFGQGCALAHVLPDGRIINRPPRGQPFAYARRGLPSQTYATGPPSLLTMQANDLASQQQQQQDFPYLAAPQPEDGSNTSYLQEPSATFGSPPNDSRLGASPNRGLSVLDVPLPGSFDSQGISHAARHGPFASSVPPRLGLESPPSSLPNKAFLGGTALRGLGDTTLDGVLHGSSPPTFDEPLSFGKRPLHSERFTRPRPMMSASVGTRPSFYSHFPPDTSESEESEEEGIGEDLLPSSLHELLPPEKLRRPSHQAADDDINPSFLSANRRAISNGSTPFDSKGGSPSPHSASPSRYSSIWSSRSYSKDAEIGPSSFGHVGSPLRPSSLRSSSLAGVDFGLAVGSPPRKPSMSMLTAELQRTSVSDKPSPLHRPGSNGSTSRGGLVERGLSSTSVGRETIEEEEQGLFSMEEEEEETDSSRKLSPPAGLIPGKSEPTLGPIGGQRTSK